MSAPRVVVQCRQDRPPLGAMLAVLATFPLLAILGFVGHRFELSPLIMLAALPPVFAPLVWRTRQATLEGSLEGLRVNGKLVIPREKLGEAWLTEHPKNGVRVHVQTAGKIASSAYRCPTAEDGDRLVAALEGAIAAGSGRAITTVVVSKRGQIAAFVGMVLGQAAPRLLGRHLEGLFGFWPSMALSLAFIGLLFTALSLARKKIVTGSDGFEIVSFRKRRFVPYTDVVRVDEQGAVHLRSGEVIPIGKPMKSSQEGDGAAPYVRALARIEEKALASRAAAGRDEAAMLAVTVAAAAGAADGSAYRVPAPTEDALWTTVAAGQARASVRARAARALVDARGAEGAESVRVRIAAIASETASTDARAALNAVADVNERDEDEHAPVAKSLRR